MATLWTPPSASNPRRKLPEVSPEHRALVRQWEQAVLSMMHQTGGILDYWNVELQKIDRNLRLMQATEAAAAPGVRAGYYHLVRLRDPVEGTFMMVTPLTGPNDEFVEPTSQMLDVLRMADLQSDRIIHERIEATRREERAQEREREREREERIEEGVERYKAATRTQILTSPDVPYAQNAAGAKRPTRGQGK